MARSYGIQYTGAVGHADHPFLCIYMATAAGVRPKIYELLFSSSAAPADNVSRCIVQRHTTAAPTGGSAPVISPIDFADPAALASAYAGSTATDTPSVVLMMFSVNLRATFRWVAAPSKEFVVPNTQWAGAGILVKAQTGGAYNPDASLFFEE